MLRFSLGNTRLDKIRNEDIRNSVEVDELGERLRETRLRWLGHIVSREEGYIGKRLRQFAVGRGRRGRPGRCWKGQKQVVK